MTGRPDPLRVCVTGSECTGKTSLAMRLADRLGAPWSAEGSRLYAERKDGPLDASDVEPIARLQVQLEEAAMAEAHDAGVRVAVLDTDLVSTMVYARAYYGEVPPEVMRAARARRADLYLLCDIDIPWVADGVRDQPSERQRMQAMFRETLAAEGVTVVDVRGGWDERWRLATDAVDELLGFRGPRAPT